MQIKSTDALPTRLLCGACNHWRTRLVSGDELMLQHVELIRQATKPATQQRYEQINQTRAIADETRSYTENICRSGSRPRLFLEIHIKEK